MFCILPTCAWHLHSELELRKSLKGKGASNDMARGNADTEKRRHRICHTKAELMKNYSEQSFEFMDSEDEDVDSESDAYICQGCHEKYDASLSLCSVCGYVNPDYTQNKKTRKLSLDGTFPKKKREKKTKKKRKRNDVNYGKSNGKVSSKYRDNRKPKKNFIKVSRYRVYKAKMANDKYKSAHCERDKRKQTPDYILKKKPPISPPVEMKQPKIILGNNFEPNPNIKSKDEGVVKLVMSDILKSVVLEVPKEKRITKVLKIREKKLEKSFQKNRTETYLSFKTLSEQQRQIEEPIDAECQTLERETFVSENVKEDKKVELKPRNGSLNSIISENGTVDSFVDLTMSDIESKPRIPSIPKFIPRAQKKPHGNTKLKKASNEEVFAESKSFTENSTKKYEFKRIKKVINKRIKYDEHLFRQANGMFTDHDMEKIQEKRVRQAKFRIECKENRVRLEYFSIANYNKTTKFQPLFSMDGIYPDFSVNDPYRVLGVTRNISLAEAKKQLKGLRIVFHPDKNSHPKANSYFVKVGEAFNEICKMNKQV